MIQFLIWGYILPAAVTLVLCLVSWGLYRPVHIPIFGNAEISHREHSLDFHWVLLWACILAILPVVNLFGIYRSVKFLCETLTAPKKPAALKPAPRAPYKVEPPSDPGHNWLQTRQQESDY